MNIKLTIDGVEYDCTPKGVVPGFPPPVSYPNGPVVPPVVPVDPAPTAPASGNTNITLDEGYWSSNSVVPPAVLKFNAQTPVVLTCFRVPPMQPFGLVKVNGKPGAGGTQFKFPAGYNEVRIDGDVPMTVSVRIRRG